MAFPTYTRSEEQASEDPEPEMPPEQIDRSARQTPRDHKTDYVAITPDLAEKWLERNRQNRRVRTDRVDRYAELMSGGDWLVSPDAIAFDHQGRLINGQHRLKAIVQSGETVQALVAWNLPPDAFKIADVGVKRTGGDVLRIEGFRNPEELAAVCRLVALWQQDRLKECNEYETVENSTIVEIAKTCSPELQGLVKKANENKLAGVHGSEMPRSLTTFVRWAYRQAHTEEIEEFYAGLINQEGFMLRKWAETIPQEALGETDEPDSYTNPVKLLRSRCRSSFENYSRSRKLGFLIKAANAYCQREPTKRLRYRQADYFPQIAAPLRSELEE